MFSQIIAQLFAYFRYPSLSGVGLALLFGLLWLLLYRLPLIKKPSLWLVMLGGAVAGVLATAFIQTPLNFLINKLWHSGGSVWLLLLVGLIAVVVSGLVQEGAKLIPLLVLRKRQGGQLDENEGLLAGAAAGFGYGWLETLWVMNALFASGWDWDVIHLEYPALVLTSLERICMLGIHMGLTAMVGWGLAKGKGLRYYLFAVLLHAFAGYLTYLMAAGLFPVIIIEIVMIIEMLVLTIVMLSIKGEKPANSTIMESNLKT